MNRGAGKGLISVKGGAFRRPAVIAASLVSLAALLALNVAAFVRGMDAPWLLGSVILADVLVVGAGIFIATREVLVADQRTEASQARLAAIVDSAMDAIITVDAAQNIVLFNGAAEQMFRCRRQEALGAPLDRFIPQRFRAGHRGHIEHFGKTGVTSRRMGVSTLWALRADGEEFPIEASISQAGEPGHRYYTVILRDVTLRKANEDALKRHQQELRELSAQVLEAREAEKTRIARELHDELGQLLTALKMDLTWLTERMPPHDAELAAKARAMGAMLDQTVASTRRISADLRPLMLDDLGLADAAGWLVDDFAKRSGIRCEFQLNGATLDDLSKAVSTAVYRALQESLTNIARHSGAKHTWVVLGMENGSIHFEVEDDGRGISPEDLSKARSLGLKGMRERVAHLGGALEVARAPRGGTRVRARIPLHGMLKEGAEP
jgi:PAS domain S-box-containing protein